MNISAREKEGFASYKSKLVIKMISFHAPVVERRLFWFRQYFSQDTRLSVHSRRVKSQLVFWHWFSLSFRILLKRTNFTTQ